MSLADLNAVEAAALIAAGEITSVELVRAHLDRIERVGASLRLLEARGFQITGVRDVFSKARNTMVPLVESRLSQADFANRRRKT